MFMKLLSQVSSNVSSLKLVGLTDSTMSSKRNNVKTYNNEIWKGMKSFSKSLQTWKIWSFQYKADLFPCDMPLSIGRITRDQFLKCELYLIPLPLIENIGEMRDVKNKSNLKKHFKFKRIYAYNKSLMLGSLMAARNFSLHHGQLTALIKIWKTHSITLSRHT